MNESKRLYVDMVKNRLAEALESGQLNPDQEFVTVDETVEKLILVEDDEITSMFKKYNDDQAKLKEKIGVAQESISKAVHEYGENVKAIYEEIKKL